jgi:hypothetical protein
VNLDTWQSEPVGIERIIGRLTRLHDRLDKVDEHLRANEREYESLIEARDLVQAQTRQLRSKLRVLTGYDGDDDEESVS